MDEHSGRKTNVKQVEQQMKARGEEEESERSCRAKGGRREEEGSALEVNKEGRNEGEDGWSLRVNREGGRKGC